MRILVDSNFPATTNGPQPGGHHIYRYDGPVVSDVDLVAHAQRMACEVVIFLGSDSLADPRLAVSARRHGVVIAASSSDDPDEAEIAVKSNLAALASKTGSMSPVIVRKSSLFVPVTE